MPNSAIAEILSLLNALSEDEQLHLIAVITERLRGRIARYTEDMETDASGAYKARGYKPRLPQMIEWGVVQIYDRLYVKGHEHEVAMLLNENEVVYDARIMRINDWAKEIAGWTAINIYEWVVVESLGKTLGELRQEYMESHGLA